MSARVTRLVVRKAENLSSDWFFLEEAEVQYPRGKVRIYGRFHEMRSLVLAIELCDSMSNTQHFGADASGDGVRIWSMSDAAQDWMVSREDADALAQQIRELLDGPYRELDPEPNHRDETPAEAHERGYAAGQKMANVLLLSKLLSELTGEDLTDDRLVSMLGSRVRLKRAVRVRGGPYLIGKEFVVYGVNRDDCLLLKDPSLGWPNSRLLRLDPGAVEVLP